MVDMETHARRDGQDGTLEGAGATRRRPVRAAVVVTLLAALGAGIAAGALLGPQTYHLAQVNCPFGYLGGSSCPPPFPLYDLLGDKLWTGIVAFFFVLAATAAIALLGALIEWTDADAAAPDRIGRAHLPPVAAAAAILFAGIAAGIAAAALLGTTLRWLPTISCPIGPPETWVRCPPPPEMVALDPNFWAGLLAFVLVLAAGTGLVTIIRRG